MKNFGKGIVIFIAIAIQIALLYGFVFTTKALGVTMMMNLLFWGFAGYFIYELFKEKKK